MTGKVHGGVIEVEGGPPLKWVSGQNGRLEFEYGTLKFAFEDLDELDPFLDALADARNEIADVLEEG